MHIVEHAERASTRQTKAHKLRAVHPEIVTSHLDHCQSRQGRVRADSAAVQAT